MKKTHGLSGTKLHFIWIEMRQRCSNTDHRNYHHYGGRGIEICKEWRDFEIFYKWSRSAGYTEGLTLDRINNDGNYSPDNCRWVDQQTQNNNKRRNKMITYKGKSQSMADWSRELNLNYSTLRSRHRNGWSDTEMLETPMEGRTYDRNKILRKR